MLQLFRKERINGLTPATILFTFFFLLFVYFLYQIANIIVLFFLAFILMVAINPVRKKIQRHLHLGRVPSIIIAYLIFILTLVLFFALLLPPLIIQFMEFAKLLNVPSLQEQLAKYSSLSVTDLSSVAGQIGTSVSRLLSIIGSTFSGIFTLFTLFVISFFLLLDRDTLHLKLSWLIKNEAELDRVGALLDNLELQLGGWVRGELLLMFIIGLMTYIGLLLLGVPYAIPLALLAGFLEILPNIGPTIAAVPAVVLSYISGGPVMALEVLGLNILVQQFENNLIVPRVMKSAVNVSPLVSIMAILIGLQLSGMMGALLAVPTYIVFRSVYKVYFYHHRL